MRARLVIQQVNFAVELRDVVLSNKPNSMLQASPKGEVPILVLEDGTVIDESLQIMLWVLEQSDPKDLLHSIDARLAGDALTLIKRFDVDFKTSLNRYRCAKRYREDNVEELRTECEAFLRDLEHRLSCHGFLISDKESVADLAIMPFIRQFAKVERQWYLSSPYPLVRRWLDSYLQSRLFSKVMFKYPLWKEGQEGIFFAQS